MILSLLISIAFLSNAIECSRAKRALAFLPFILPGSVALMMPRILSGDSFRTDSITSSCLIFISVLLVQDELCSTDKTAKIKARRILIRFVICSMKSDMAQDSLGLLIKWSNTSLVPRLLRHFTILSLSFLHRNIFRNQEPDSMCQIFPAYQR